MDGRFIDLMDPLEIPRFGHHRVNIRENARLIAIMANDGDGMKPLLLIEFVRQD